MKKESKKPSEAFDYEKFEKEAVKKLLSGKGLTGKDGVLTGLIGRLIAAAYDEEIKQHLTEAEESNRRNGYTSKTVKTSLGALQINPPRDRNGSFEPQIIAKRHRSLAPEIEQQILSLYARGSSYIDISRFVEETYGVQYSPSTLTAITDRIFDELRVWKSRPLEPMYAVIYLDAIHYKIREDRQVQTRAVYTVYGVDLEGNRDVLDLVIGQAESSKQWARILESLKDRGVEDVLFFCVDGLNGFKEAIESSFPKSILQRCIVHLVRNSCKYISSKDRRAVCRDLKEIYTCDSAELGYEQLQVFKERWSNYEAVGELWERNWMELSPFFDYSSALRRMIYTTNAVEALHRIMRKVTKTKGAFVSAEALQKQLYLAIKYSEKSWKRKARSWTEILIVLHREFEDRIVHYI